MTDKRSFESYIRDLLPIPIVKCDKSKRDGYKYRIKTYSSVVYESESVIRNRLKKCKRIQCFSDWYCDNDPYYRYMIIEFMKGYKK